MCALWEEFSIIQLTPDREDTIRWCWTAEGATQQKCLFGQIPWELLKAQATSHLEPKCRFFAWTPLHHKILIVDNLLKRGWQQDPIFRLCKQALESILHLCNDYIFSKAVWDLLLSWFNKTDLWIVSQQGSVYAWWKRMRKKVAAQVCRVLDGIVIYFWWELWKERNRRSFQNVEKFVLVVASFIREDLNLCCAAFAPSVWVCIFLVLVFL